MTTRLCKLYLLGLTGVKLDGRGMARGKRLEA